MCTLGSMHKWMMAVRGCGVLYSAPEYDLTIKPVITAQDVNEPFPDCFKKQGTRDDVPLFQTEQCYNFYNYCGGMVCVRNYHAYLFIYPYTQNAKR